MDATLIVIDSDAELARAQKLIARLMSSGIAADIARLTAQAQLVAAYEERRWPPRRSSPAAIVHYLMDQHGLSRADMVPLLGTASRVSEVLSGKKRLSIAMVQRLRARFNVPADLLIADVAGAHKAPKRAGAPRRRGRNAA
jgi:HTH-type transcriptional regulator/antitoxin HigA